MRRYKVIDAIFLSFYSKDLYDDVYRNWPGKGFAYLLVVVFFFSLGEIVQMQNHITDFIEAKGPGIVSQVPELSFQNGALRIKGKNPVTIYDPLDKFPLVLMDTTLTAPDSVGGSYFMIIGKNKMLVRNGEVTQSVDLAELNGLIITQDAVSYWFQVVGNWFVPMLAPFLILQAWIFQILITLFFTLISMLFNRSSKVKIPYAVVFRITAVALTPMIFLQALSGLIQFPSFFNDFIIPLAGVLYLAFAFKTLNTDKE